MTNVCEYAKTVKHITVKNDFIGYHRYANAPEDVAFLRAWHRHHFIVKTSIPVNHNEREFEFFELQNKIKEYVEGVYTKEKEEVGYLPGIWIESCETFAEDLAIYVKQLTNSSFAEVAVSEDEECEAVVRVEDIAC